MRISTLTCTLKNTHGTACSTVRPNRTVWARARLAPAAVIHMLGWSPSDVQLSKTPWLDTCRTPAWSQDAEPTAHAPLARPKPTRPLTAAPAAPAVAASPPRASL
eukprot:15441817-Alexandrium_andersonii.AAC.1